MLVFNTHDTHFPPNKLKLSRQVCTVILVSSVVQVAAFGSDPVLLEVAPIQVMHALVDFFANLAAQVSTVTLVSLVVQVAAFVSDPELPEVAF